MEDKVNISKIIVNGTHELTDIVKEIHKSKSDRVVLTFTDQSDLLISPINLKVLQEVAEKEKKLLIAQIIQNPTGVRNGRLAGIKVVENPSSPTEQDWQDALENIESKAREKISKKKVEQLAKEEEVAKTSSFEDRVNNALSKSREERKVVPNDIPQAAPFISIDEDLPSDKRDSLAGRDFASIPQTENVPPRVPNIKPLRKGFRFDFSKFDFKNKKFLRIFLLVIAFLILIPGLTFAVYNQMVPLAKVKIFVEAKPVQIEKVFVGDLNIEEVDFDNLKIPIKTGEETKSLSDTITPTGKAFKGEKAKGVVTLTYNNTSGCGETDTPITLNIGQKITATTGESYILTGGAQLTCPKILDVPVESVEVGTEYNLGAGKSFSVTGYASSTLSGFNAAAFTGGSKEEYTVLSQQDLDTAIEKLSTTAIEEVKSTLRENETSWDIIENSIKSEVEKGSTKTDKKVGEEATVVNLDITIKGTATYYSTKGLDEGITELLRQEAMEKNLFETEDDIELVLGDNVEKKLTVDETVTDSVQIKLEASSTIKPKVDKTGIENELKGMSWEEGLKYISTIDYSDQKTEVQFIPDNYPEFLKRFPDRQGGVLVSIGELKAEE